MTRFSECAWSDVPFGLLGRVSIGTATSGGCNCVQSPTQEPDPLALELEANVCANGIHAGTSVAQP